MKVTPKIFIIWTSLLFLLLNSGCVTKEKEILDDQGSYLKAMNMLKDGQYEEAAKIFENIDDEYPFSPWATKAQVIAAYCYYMEKEYMEVIRIVDDFAVLSPSNPNMPYMIYLKGMAYYNQIPDVQRSQELARAASDTFRDLITRFPGSKYDKDTREKLVFVDNHTAAAIMNNGREDIENKNYISAINKFNQVIDYYNYTNQAPEAYFRLIEIYYKLGVESEARKIDNILQTTYPDSIWSQRSKEITK